ncbi:MAG: TetR/AcrR family transcriptional regulator, partial [Deltaproteobacteria bacterium]|nr:TetR/AcrR family transcriptional regulator [Deltaproteobacteria bacterium]
MSETKTDEAPRKPLTKKQLAIFEAALDVFSEQGFARTATSEIARRAGVAEGTIFRTWRTKKDLLTALVTPVILKLVAPVFVKEIQIIAGAEHEDLSGFVRALYRNRIENVVKKHPRAVRILLQEIAFHPEIQELVRHEAGEQLVPPLLEAIRRFQENGAIGPMPPGAVLRLLVVNFA